MTQSPIGRGGAGLLRLLLVVAGGLVVLQSSQGLGPAKIGYLIVAGIALLAATRSVWTARGSAMVRAARGWLVASAVLLTLIAVSLPVALAHGTPLGQWLRDAATYGLFAAAPIFALDAAASRSPKTILGMTLGVTGLGAVSYAVNWISLRNLAVLPIGQIVLPTASLPTTLFVVALGAAIVNRRRRAAWVLLAGVALGIFLVTGTRSALFLLVAIPAAAVVAGRRAARISLGVGLGTAAVAAIFLLTTQAVFIAAGGGLAPPLDTTPTASASPIAPGRSVQPGPVVTTSGDPNVTVPPRSTPAPDLRPPPNPNANLIQRIGEFLTSPSRDGSVRERVTQYGVAWNLFTSSPVLGVGLGHPIVWTRLDGTVRTDFTADTPLILPAKFGLLGVVWLVLLAIAWVRFLVVLRQAGRGSMAAMALTGWAAILVALAWSGFIIEDKGFSFALMLLLSLGFIEIECGPAKQDRHPGTVKRQGERAKGQTALS